MVDRSDLNQAAQLYGQLSDLERAIAYIDDGAAQILSFTIGRTPASPPTGPPPLPATIPAVGLDYPPAMLQTIGQLLAARQHAIEDELSSLGVTGIEAR